VTDVPTLQDTVEGMLACWHEDLIGGAGLALLPPGVCVGCVISEVLEEFEGGGHVHGDLQ
jgi:hypothetical protein